MHIDATPGRAKTAAVITDFDFTSMPTMTKNYPRSKGWFTTYTQPFKNQSKNVLTQIPDSK